MAAHYLELIQSIQPQGPYYLGGHSFGGWVAFEMAQQLQKQGQTVGLVAILDKEAPLSVKESPPHPPEPEQDQVFWLCRMIEVINALLQRHSDIGEEAEKLRRLSSSEQLLYLKDYLQAAHLITPHSDVDHIHQLVDIFKLHFQMSYVPENAIPTNIVVFRTNDMTDKQENFSQMAFAQDPYLGWQSWATDAIQAYNIPGNHITMMSSPHVKVLADTLNRMMNE
jgi:thioesterase domain-containing protein